METLLMGAVAYDPKVVTISEGFRRWLLPAGVPFDFVLYSNYERQVDERIAAARGRSVRSAVMRDTDQGLTSVGVVRADSDYASLADLTGPDGRSARWTPRRPPSSRWRTCARPGCSRVRTSRSAASTSASGCTATTSVASATPPVRWSPARSWPRA